MRLPAVCLVLLAACGSAPEIRREPAVEEADRERQLKLDDQKFRDFRAVLVRLDQSIDSYAAALSNQGEARADAQAERLYKAIHEMVLDLGPMLVRRKSEPVRPGETFERLRDLATNTENPSDQGLALAALGFSGRHEVMPTILQGAQLGDPTVVDCAVLGLAVLRAPATPPGVLEAIFRNGKHPEEGRVQAAWALYRVQTASPPSEAIAGIWRRTLADAPSLPAGVVVSALRGLGYVRDSKDGALAAPFLKDPTPRVRMAAALALGRMNAQEQWPALVEALGPQETVQNVRLHARKALAALAGGVDHGYDVLAWRKTFTRS
jgi:hypothetical protein